MALTPSTMVELGTRAPGFSLNEPLTNRQVSFEDVRGERGTLVMFICNHCPYVHHVQAELVRLAHDYSEQGIGIVAISSNDVENYPDDSPEKMAREARDYPFPYLYDETQDVARAYHAACTPDFFVYDKNDELIYRGQLDATQPGKGTPDGADLRAALRALLAGEPPLEDQKPSAGCNIKWKPA
ncbi:MAG: thioredoxin family protein [Candidatus Woesearchaeota archaeon]